MYFLDAVAIREAASSNVFLLLFRLAHFNRTVSDPSSPHQGRNRHDRVDLLECKSALLVSFESDIQYHYSRSVVHKLLESRAEIL